MKKIKQRQKGRQLDFFSTQLDEHGDLSPALVGNALPGTSRWQDHDTPSTFHTFTAASAPQEITLELRPDNPAHALLVCIECLHSLSRICETPHEHACIERSADRLLAIGTPGYAGHTCGMCRPSFVPQVDEPEEDE